jgi:hypothetical protein
MSSQPATLEGFIRNYRLNLASRSAAEWWGTIVLKDPTFDFFIVIFEPQPPDANIGQSALFAWHESGDLRMRRIDLTNRPKLEDNNLTITIPTQANNFLGGVPFKKLSASLVEAFLDDWHRSKILTALSNDD